jgi:hypothetical protein
MKEDEDSFYQGKLSSKSSIENDADADNSKRNERSLPVLGLVGSDIQYKETLNKGSCQKGTTGDGSLPSNSAKPAYLGVSESGRRDMLDGAHL